MVTYKAVTAGLGLLTVGGIGSTAYAAFKDPKEIVAFFTGEKTYTFKAGQEEVRLKCDPGKYPNIGVIDNEVVILCQANKEQPSFKALLDFKREAIQCSLDSGTYSCSLNNGQVHLKNTQVRFEQKKVEAISLSQSPS
ncbi:hypothetical protein MHLP_03010 [Candidatus Mycoplasma haematolamae str. Purdue]|uniref:Ig-like domain-containing protein n=1 Tax=Mycoplasma haematolamae (strain Purdue) TaxID=1212765 RepID=I7C6M9_MYCHA|nr:hypothetical protein [Candidatus Mycoplasma haematolamae]AFO52182.1 hypothetical protein MHLP_03010 [Candidatus Mycoplasma haematolamae str. Purdue]